MKNATFSKWPLATFRIFIFLLFLSGLYLAVATRFHVGSMSDDARDILAAKSILMGGYRDLQAPGYPPAVFPLPGFPLLLAPLVAVAGSHVDVLRAVPFAATLLALLLFVKLLTSWVRRDWLLALLALFALNPTTVVSATRVIADAAYMAALLGSFLLLRKTLRAGTNAGVWPLALVVGAATLIRPEGLLLIPAIAFVFAYGKRWASGAAFALVAATPGLLFWVRNHCAAPSSGGYGTIWSHLLPVLGHGYQPLIENLQTQLALWTGNLMVGWEALPAGVLWAAAVGLGLLAVSGAVRLFAGALPEALVPFAMFLYAGLHLLLHVAWLAADTHYLWPLLPITLAFLAAGMEIVSERWSPWIARAAVLVLLVVYGWHYVHAFQRTVRRQEPALPAAAMAWLRDHTSQDAFVLAPNAPRVTLYTSRHAMALLGASDAEEFRYRLQERGITHVWVSAPEFLYVKMLKGRSPEDQWKQAAAWIRASPASFKPVFNDPAEGVEIFEVQPDPQLVKAFKLFLQARDMVVAERLGEAQALLQASFEYFHLPQALNLFGVIGLMTSSNLEDAQSALEEALELRPNYGVAALNLARVLRRLGQEEAAQAAFARARELLLADPDQSNAFLIRQLDVEAAPLPAAIAGNAS